MAQPQSEALLTVDEVAARLRCHAHTVRRWIWSGKLSAVKVGDLVRVPESALAHLLRPATPVGKGASSRGVAALLATIEDLRGEVDSADVEILEGLLSASEGPADWADPLG